MKQILNVENDNINAFLTERMLRDVCVVHTAEDEPEMYQLLSSQPISLVLMDIHLGEDKADGTQLLQQLREDPRYSHLPIIAVTAYAMPGDEDRFLAMGFNAYLAKPFLQEDLEMLVKTLAV